LLEAVIVKKLPRLVDFCVIFISFAKKPEAAMHVTHTQTNFES